MIIIYSMCSQVRVFKNWNISLTFNAFGNVWEQSENNTFKIKITKLDMFINN